MNADDEPGFDPARILRSLSDHAVRFVLIGGWAAKLQGSPTVTADIDISYDRAQGNLERLASALSAFDVRLRDVPDDVPFVLDARVLPAGDSFTLTSSVGDIDLIASPAGITSFDELFSHADTLELDEMRIRVASIHDLIVMKTAAGRPKDLVEVEILTALAEEIGHKPG